MFSGESDLESINIRPVCGGEVISSHNKNLSRLAYHHYHCVMVWSAIFYDSKFFPIILGTVLTAQLYVDSIQYAFA